MKEYTNVILTMALIYGGVMGFINWIGAMADSLDYGQTFMFVLQLIFVEILLPFHGFLPFLGAFVLFFVVGLPFYGIYKLFK